MLHKRSPILSCLPSIPKLTVSSQATPNVFKACISGHSNSRTRCTIHCGVLSSDYSIHLRHCLYRHPGIPTLSHANSKLENPSSYQTFPTFDRSTEFRSSTSDIDLWTTYQYPDSYRHVPEHRTSRRRSKACICNQTQSRARSRRPWLAQDVPHIQLC
jgi:hypothetical protein